MTGAGRPHHGPHGFRNPWPDDGERTFKAFLRWQWERARNRNSLPRPIAMPLARPEPARPRAAAGEMRATWVGHATFLLQIGTLNLLTDPVWSARVSPIGCLGPRRLAPPGVALDALPPIDAVLLTHGHFDHLDAATVRALAARQPAAPWVTPPGYRDWLLARGVRRVVELDWWQATTLGEGAGARVTALPARHWSRRTPWDDGLRLWASFAVETPDGRVFFGCDSGYCPAFAEIGERLGGFDLTLLPIGAYAPRWFMRAAHMDPAEAVRAWQDLGGAGRLVAMHWGTFILSDEPVLEPPELLRAAWQAAGCRTADLSILRHGETLRMEGAGSDADEPQRPDS